VVTWNATIIFHPYVAVGVMPLFNINKIQPTMVACSTHKWLRGPSGCSLVYISPRVHQEWLPLDLHGRGRDIPGGVGISKNEIGPNGYPDKFFSDARKFDCGGKANPITVPMLEASLEQVVLLDPVQTQQRLQNLMRPLLTSIIQEMGGRFSISGPKPRAFHVIGIVPRNKTPEELIELSQLLEQDCGIIVAVRCGGLRVSPYLTNTPDDVTALIEALRQLPN
jgi:selenocysteine lyase/cysteine desulfurase